MKIEVNSAAEFLMNLLRVRQKIAVTDSQLESFRGQLADQLTQRYQRHWYPEMPHKGSGYRCIRINGKMDPLVEQAGVAAGLPTRTLRKLLPPELTLWIDPDEVCNYIFLTKKKNVEPWSAKLYTKNYDRIRKFKKNTNNCIRNVFLSV